MSRKLFIEIIKTKYKTKIKIKLKNIFYYSFTNDAF